VKRAILAHRRDFVAIVALVVLAAATVAYILAHQPSFTLGRSYYTVRAAFSDAAAVTPGQGQSVTIAGVQVGTVGGVQLEHGQAVVTMDIFKQYAPIYRDATVLLRPRTPLKDMYLALDPGTHGAGAVPNGGLLPVGSTQPTVDVDQILGSLDADTRTYLLLLLSGGAEAFSGPGAGPGRPSPGTVADLRSIFRRFAPLDENIQTFTKLLATRSDSLRHVIHNLNLVTGALGSVDSQLASLVRAANTNFSAISSQASALGQGLTLLPGALQQTNDTLGKVQRFAAATGPTLEQLRPLARELNPALAAVGSLAHDTTPAVANQLRPFARQVQPLAKALGPAAATLVKPAAPLTSSFAVFNKLLNTLAYQQPGGTPGYLYWGGWLAHIADSLTSMQDANGPIIQGLFMATCPALNLLESLLPHTTPSLAPLVALLGAPNYARIHSSYCPPAGSL